MNLPLGCISLTNAFFRRLFRYNATGRTPLIYKFTLAKEYEICKKMLRKSFQQIIDKYRDETNEPTIKSQDEIYKNNPAYIWICWLQGFEQLPYPIELCINSIKKNAGNYEVKLIQEENIHEYVEIPPTLLDKYKQGIICPANFSDIVRCLLLKKWGGCWFDATYFLYDIIDPAIFNYPFFSIAIKTKDQYWNIQKGK